jgi:predicted AAA+ superfamily ATPase
MGVRGSFWACVRELALSSDNPFTRAVERGDRITGDETMTGGSAIPPLLTQLARDDLDRLGRIAAFDLSALGFSIALYLRARNLEEAASHIEAEARILWRSEGAGPGDKPDAGPPDRQAPFRPGTPWGAFPEEAAAHIRRRGAGAFSRHRFFRWESGGPALPAAARLTAGGGVPRGVPRPVPYPDPITLSDLVGYESQRSLVLHNTLAFLEGKMASNLLLYGDRGTGKSATVKAVCREYSDRGLRLLELHKEDMAELPGILEFTALRGLSFVVFIDDLSFEGLDDSFTSLKALLEGGAGTRPPNTVIYATSNRRRLVRESPAGRQGSPGSGDGEARSFDTIQEQLSLSDRFGLTVIFTAPSQEEYLRIARGIADRRGVAPDSRFRENALRWEQWFNGRSPRTASQFVDWLKGGKPFPWD